MLTKEVKRNLTMNSNAFDNTNQKSNKKRLQRKISIGVILVLLMYLTISRY